MATCKPSTNSATCESVLTYIKNKANIANRGEISVDRLRTKGDTSSFKVGIDSKYMSQVEADNFWPENIIVRDFKFNHRIRQAGMSQLHGRHARAGSYNGGQGNSNFFWSQGGRTRY